MTNTLTAGAGGGALATAAMSAVMLAGSKANLMGDQPPKRIVRALLPGHKHRPKKGEKLLGTVAHFAFGTASGAFFGVLCRDRPARLPAGIGYALAIWLASYQGWVPSMNILPPISRDRPGRRLVMAVGHIVYGATLVLAMNRLRAKSSESTSPDSTLPDPDWEALKATYRGPTRRGPRSRRGATRRGD